MNIFSICIVDKYALQEVQWIGRAGYATRLCVLNEEVKKLFINCGRAEDEVCVTGNPAFERLQLQETRVAGLEFRRIKHWDDGSLNILWASQIEPKRHPFTGVIGDPNLPRSIEKCLRSFVAKHKKYRLIVRYHPSENIDFQQGQPNVEFSPLSEDLSVLLNAVDIVVVMTSNVGLEAKLAGCEVISVENSIFADDCPYGQMGVSTPVNSLPELEAAIFKLKREGGSERHVEFHSDEDLPTNKIVKIIDHLAFNPSKSKENHESNT